MKLIDLSAVEDPHSFLIYGGYGAGKTHLQGDFLRWCRAQGGQTAFLNIAGEDGYRSLGTDVGFAATVESVDDFDAVVGELAKQDLFGLAVDSLTAWNLLVMVGLLGSARYPDPKIDGERAKMVWGQAAMRTRAGVILSRRAARYVLWVAPHDRSENPVTGERQLSPDLPGRQANGCAGWFEAVGVLTADVLATNHIKREVDFRPRSNTINRLRGTRCMQAPVPIPEGSGGWANILEAVREATAVPAPPPAPPETPYPPPETPHTPPEKPYTPPRRRWRPVTRT
jgi:hypothetical protein